MTVRITGAKTNKPQIPKTTLGTAASNSMSIATGAAKRRGAISASNNAAPKPIGAARMSAMADVMTVAYMKERTADFPLLGSQVTLWMACQPTVFAAGHAAMARVTKSATTMTKTIHAANPKIPTMG